MLVPGVSRTDAASRVKEMVRKIHLQSQPRDATMSKRTKTKQEDEDRETSDTRTTVMPAESQKFIADALGTEVNELMATYAGQEDAQP